MAARDQFNPSLDVFMPLYIGRFLQNTSHLDGQESGALLLLLMHEWIRGPLPNNPERLALIAKLRPDAWSMSQASVMHFFKTNQAGQLYSTFLERLKDEWMGKRLKAHEKAQKAANARWSKQRAKKQAQGEQGANKSDAPSIPQALLEECPISTQEEQIQKPPYPHPIHAVDGDVASSHAPSISRRQAGISPRQLGRSPRQLGASPTQRGASPRQAGISPRALGKSPRQLGKSPRQTKQKAKPPESTAGAAAGTRNGAMGHAGGSNGRAVPPAAAAGHQKKPPAVQNPDSRLEAFEGEVLEFWRGQNPEHPSYHINAPDRRALVDLLERHPHLRLEDFRRLLQNRAQSEINPSAAPCKWLRSVVEYSSGPLRKFGKLAVASRSV